MESYHKSSPLLSPEQLTADELISNFLKAEVQLITCMETDEEVVIQLEADKVDRLLEQLFAYNSDCQNEMKKIMQFLADKFIVTEHGSNELRRKVCEKFLAMI